MKLEKYENLQQEAENIKENLYTLYNKITAEPVELVQIKIEPNTDKGMSIQCQKCFEEFSSLAELKDHKNCEEKFFEDFIASSDDDFSPRKKKSKKKITPNKVEPKFKKLAKESGVNYDIQKFQKAFGKKNDYQSWISPEFAKTLKEYGVNYDLQTFHRVFGLSDRLDINKDKKSESFKCSKCGEEFKKLEQYKNHVKMHSVGAFR